MSAAISEARLNFNQWAKDFKEAANFRRENEATTWAVKWWGDMDIRLKHTMLYMVCGDFGERYHHALWKSIPDNVRDDLMLLGRTIERGFRGAPWR